jgi:hypothetical protein
MAFPPPNVTIQSLQQSVPSSSLPDATASSKGGVKKRADIIDVMLDKGAVADATTNDAAAFSSAYSDVAAGIYFNNSLFGSNRRGTKVIEIPAGTYVVTSAEALMTDLGIARTNGLTIKGAGRHMTTIVFSPGTADQYLLNNNDDFLHITFEDLTFHSTVASASFMRSVSSGGAQNYAFNRVNWQGTWKYGLDVQGTNTNSEMSWFHCGVYGDWTAFLYAGASGTSDQFLNYDFFKCQVEYSSGNFVDMAMGGNINVWGGSLIHTGNGSADQTFFALRGNGHASGVERLMIRGARVEHRHVLSHLLYCEWNRGNISCISLDTENQAGITGAATIQTVQFVAGNHELPSVVFDNCSLMGQHSYNFKSNSYPYRRRIVYRSCDIENYDEASNFINIVNTDSTGNVGGTPPIVFENCRGNAASSSAAHTFDCILNSQLAQNSERRQYQVSVTRPAGGLPTQTTTSEVYLPLNARIIGVRFTKDSSGSAGNTNYQYILNTNEGSPTNICTLTGDGATAWSAGFDVAFEDLSFLCDSDNKRHLTLSAANITQSQPTSNCIITYLA